jgi:2-C-methyl-D-erythritol 4-phosphate cytidylyltransferase
VKRSADGHSVSETVPREGLWLAQTPQALRRTEALTAFAAADEANWQGTDDVSLMERAGHAVHLVTGDASNLKVTTPDDWDLAEAILHHRLSLEDGAL